MLHLPQIGDYRQADCPNRRPIGRLEDAISEHQETPATFDDVFGAYEQSPRLRELFATTLDTTLPQEIEPLSFAPLAALRSVLVAVRVRADELLVDLGCGRGGPGMWVARAIQTRLVGVDSSPVAITQAQRRVASFGLRGRAQFLVGDLTATGLADASADGVMCIDSFHFAADHVRAAQEVLRILRPGRRLALTSWEPRQPADPSLPAGLARLVIAEVLASAGFTSITVREHPEWEQGRAAMYEAALAADAGTDRALQAFQASAREAFPLMAHLRRVLVIAERPTWVGR